MFGSQRPHVLDDPVKKERRSWNRVPVQVGVFCQNVQGEDELCWSARVVDISRAGMKLLSPHRFDPNTTIRIARPPFATATMIANPPRRLYVNLPRARVPRVLVREFGAIGFRASCSRF